MMTGRAVLLVLLAAAVVHADELTVVVVDADGKPVARAPLTVEVGRVRLFGRWHAVDYKRGSTDETGQATFTELPDGGVCTALAYTGAAVGHAQGAGKLEVRLGPGGTVQGKVLGKRSVLKGLTVSVTGGDGLGYGQSKVDKKTGKWEVKALVPGAGVVAVRRDNFYVARSDVAIADGKTTKTKSIKVKDEFLPEADPLVKCMKARLVDGDNKPVPGVSLSFSSRWMDGGLGADEDGMVRLAGGGVAIGGPPYRLRLQTLRDKERAFAGTLLKVRRGVAIIQLNPLHPVTGRVTRGKEAVEKYVMAVRGPGETPRIYRVSVKEGAFEVFLPQGACKVALGTVDGKVHETVIEVGEGPLVHDISLD